MAEIRVVSSLQIGRRQKSSLQNGWRVQFSIEGMREPFGTPAGLARPADVTPVDVTPVDVAPVDVAPADACST